jgi:hypothetical protein
MARALEESGVAETEIASERAQCRPQSPCKPSRREIGGKATAGRREAGFRGGNPELGALAERCEWMP